MRFAICVAFAALVACGGAQHPSAPADPQACVVGEYAGRGSDQGGVTWTFTLALQVVGPDVVGAFHWVGSDGSVGDEQIRGHADCAAHTFVWDGQTASGGSAEMDVVTAHYTGTIGDGGASLVGSWSDTQGNGGIPGTFTAQRR